MSKKCKDVKPFAIKPTDIVTVTSMGHITEIQYMEKMNQKASIRKINKDQYVVLETGEIKEYEHIKNRSESYNSLRQTFKKVRYLINKNFFGNGNELHCILTYEKNVTDNSVLYFDFNRFMIRLKRKYSHLGSIDYMNVVEPQGRGAWHCHVLIRFNDVRSIYIPNKDIAEIWGQGFVTIKSLKGVDNIGAYLSAYLADLELTDETIKVALNEDREVVEKDVAGVKKKFIKGGRLHMYPPGMNLYRKSKGIVYPERYKTTYKKAKKIVGSAQPHYFNSIDIEQGDFKNKIAYEQYNSKRV